MRLKLACQLASGCSGNVLDCATGTGEITQAILSSGHFHSGTIVDISANMLRHSEMRLQKTAARCNLEFIQSDIFDFNGDGSGRRFDLIVCLGLLPHVGQVEDLLKHLKTHLAGDGRLLCQFTLANHPSTRLVRVLTQHRYVRKHGYPISYCSQTQFEESCANARLRIVDLRRHALGMSFGDRMWAWGNYQAELLFQRWAPRYGAEAIYLLAHR
jgi:cyclopropane fatty-acyl-phospholipid synthase-like methyltransferase